MMKGTDRKADSQSKVPKGMLPMKFFTPLDDPGSVHAILRLCKIRSKADGNYGTDYSIS